MSFSPRENEPPKNPKRNACVPKAQTRAVHMNGGMRAEERGSLACRSKHTCSRMTPRRFQYILLSVGEGWSRMANLNAADLTLSFGNS